MYDALWGEMDNGTEVQDCGRHKFSTWSTNGESRIHLCFAKNKLVQIKAWHLFILIFFGHPQQIKGIAGCRFYAGWVCVKQKSLLWGSGGDSVASTVAKTTLKCSWRKVFPSSPRSCKCDRSTEMSVLHQFFLQRSGPLKWNAWYERSAPPVK